MHVLCVALLCHNQSEHIRSRDKANQRVILYEYTEIKSKNYINTADVTNRLSSNL